MSAVPGLEGQTAALALAQSLGIAIKRYSSPDQREAIARGRYPAGQPIAPANAVNAIYLADRFI